jgi:hypothetical protein
LLLAVATAATAAAAAAAAATESSLLFSSIYARRPHALPCHAMHPLLFYVTRQR